MASQVSQAYMACPGVGDAAGVIHPANQAVFQAIFGMVFTVIIALEFKHSLLIALARQESAVRLHSVILIAMLAMVRKFIVIVVVIDLGISAPGELLALAAAILALGAVYWMVREQDARIVASPTEGEKPARPLPFL